LEIRRSTEESVLCCWQYRQQNDKVACRSKTGSYSHVKEQATRKASGNIERLSTKLKRIDMLFTTTASKRNRKLN